MKKYSILLILAAFILMITACKREVGPLSPEDVTANRAITDEFIQAARSGDWAAVAALYTEDTVLMPANRPLVQGRAAIQAWMEEFPTITGFNLTIEQIDGRGDLAYVRGTYSMTITPEGAPEPIQDTGKYVEIRRKQSDSSWLISIDILNSDLPIPEQLTET